MGACGAVTLVRVGFGPYGFDDSDVRADNAVTESMLNHSLSTEKWSRGSPEMPRRISQMSWKVFFMSAANATRSIS